MSLVEHTLFGIVDREAQAIERINAIVCPSFCVKFSGGKDSIVVLDLVKKAGVPYTAVFNNTTVEIPAVYRFIRDKHPQVIISHPPESMWQLIGRKGLPTRQRRWCCELLKHRDVRGDIIITGIRREESPRRAKTNWVEVCRHDPSQRLLNPIYDWSEDDVWAYIRKYNLEVPPVYSADVRRVGCIGCPLSHRQSKELALYPKIAELYRRAACRYVEHRKAIGKPTNWESGDQYYKWWVEWDGEADNEDQGELFG